MIAIARGREQESNRKQGMPEPCQSVLRADSASFGGGGWMSKWAHVWVPVRQ